MTPRCRACDGMGEIRTMVCSSAISGLGERWVEEVARQREEIERLRAEVQRQTRHVEQLYDQIRRRADERDKAQIEVEQLRADNERLTRERDESRYFLKIFVHAHASNNAVPPHLEEQARKALESKP